MKIPQTTPRIIQTLKKLDLLDKQINGILMYWDPIGFGKIQGFEHNLWEEYIRYIPKLRDALDTKKPIRPIIDWIEGESIGCFYTSAEKRLEVSILLEQLIPNT